MAMDRLNDGFLDSYLDITVDLPKFKVSAYKKDVDDKYILDDDGKKVHEFEPATIIGAKVNLKSCTLRDILRNWAVKKLVIKCQDTTRPLADPEKITQWFRGEDGHMRTIDAKELETQPRAASKAKMELAVAGQEQEEFIQSIKRMCQIRKMTEKQTEATIKAMTS